MQKEAGSVIQRVAVEVTYPSSLLNWYKVLTHCLDKGGGCRVDVQTRAVQVGGV